MRRISGGCYPLCNPDLTPWGGSYRFDRPRNERPGTVLSSSPLFLILPLRLPFWSPSRLQVSAGRFDCSRSVVSGAGVFVLWFFVPERVSGRPRFGLRVGVLVGSSCKRYLSGGVCGFPGVLAGCDWGFSGGWVWKFVLWLNYRGFWSISGVGGKVAPGLKDGLGYIEVVWGGIYSYDIS